MILTVALLSLTVATDAPAQLPLSRSSEAVCRHVSDTGHPRIACLEASLEVVVATLNQYDPSYSWVLHERSENWRCVMTGEFNPNDRQETIQFLSDWGIEANAADGSHDIELRTVKRCQNAASDEVNTGCRYEYTPSSGDGIVCDEATLDKLVDAVNHVSEWKLILPDVQPQTWQRFAARLDADARSLAKMLLAAGFTMQRQYDQKKIIITHVPGQVLD